MEAKPVGTADFECTHCDIIMEGKNGSEIICPKCGENMSKLFGGRANSGGHDLRHQDKGATNDNQ